MSITHKLSQTENLDTFRTWIVDTNATSTYFRLANIPDVLTAGKNAFLINGSPYLEPHTPVKVEIKDVDGNVVFSEPIKYYTEGLARVVSIEVYSDTPQGLGMITILGHLRNDENGKLPPPEFVNSYNVKWQQRVMIAPLQGNSTTVRLYRRPVVSVTEILNPFRKATAPIIQVTGSAGSQIEAISLNNAINLGNPVPNAYIIEVTTPSVAKQMEGGTLTCTVNGQPFSASIETVINSSMFQITTGLTSGTLFVPFLTSDYTMSYTGSPSYLVTESTRSFADISLTNLSTFSGDIYRVKTFVSSIDSPGNPELISDTRVEAAEMLLTSSYMSGQSKIRSGYFTDTPFVQTYWLIGALAPTSSMYNPG